ncbi:hypothetical protein ASF10_14880 [Flavobacterium sp. Leaf82]|uniref:hypothetical protein n=1 Tax=Flavobacterium sp. Leaf82 TaxID=1736238 RepID=UPI0007017C9D|nr:hypothetical protein [Flavobacterium sp. Leaf82]KQO20867.1 hypothetical protein ASF10_14880 [Flavobacterium sp. Leaf82]
MKKIIMLLVSVFLSACQLQAQQAKQKRMLLLQIAALRTYVDYAAKGYKAVKSGLNFISDVKKGEVNLHSDYFTSLVSVNPKVKKYGRVAEIITLQIEIFKIYKNTLASLPQDDLFHGNELEYIERTFRRLVNSCDDNLDLLLLITTSTSLEMKDDERIERIDKLYEAAREDYSFCKKFSGEIKLLALSKAREKNDVKQAEVLLGL